MALKKTIASYRGENGEIIPQYDIEMHPLEEAEIRAHWAIHDCSIKCPQKPSQQDEHEWLIIYGADYVRQKRDEWQKAYDANHPSVEEARIKFEAAHEAWKNHCEHCVANGLNPNTHDKDKYNAA